MITPRATRLVRSADLGGFREALVTLACDGDPLAARDRLVIVPTRAAAAHLVRAIEDRRLHAEAALVLPELVTASELVSTFADRLPVPVRIATDERREVLLGAACRTVADEGVEPPFRLRPGIVAEMLRFYDAIRRQRRDVEAFERLALSRLEPGAEYDRGAERLVRQTRFLAAAFREFERRALEAGLVDGHAAMQLVLETPSTRPWLHAVVAVGDRSRDAYGLWAADWDLLARVPGLQQLDVIVTDQALAGALHQRMHDLLPGIEEVRIETPPSVPSLRLSAQGMSVRVARDREEEVADFARWVKTRARMPGAPALERMALVVKQPLPYVYVAREVLRSAGIPSQTFDALPLAAEPYSAALDLVLSAVAGDFARGPAVALMRSPHFEFFAEGRPVSAGSIAALDRALSEHGYLGGVEHLSRLVAAWESADEPRGTAGRALPAARALLKTATMLSSLRQDRPIAEHLVVLFAFLTRHERQPGADLLRERHLRTRGAVHRILTSLRDAYNELDQRPAAFDTVTALIRRWIEEHTFTPRSGDAGVHIVDAESARFGDFTHVQLAGLIDGEWPSPPVRNVFYSSSILKDLGWPSEADRLDGSRAAFCDLLRLPSEQLTVSTFSLEYDAVVAPSTVIDEVDRAGLPGVRAEDERIQIFDHEALTSAPLEAVEDADLHVGDGALAANGSSVPPFQAARGFSLSSLERYQDCPFKFFASDVLRLEEPLEDEAALSPRARGRFVHEVFQRFYEAWGTRALTPSELDEARAMFRDAAEPLLANLPESDAALERARLFGTAISVGVVDVVLGIEASRPVPVRERLLEYRLEGEFHIGGDRPVALRGVADRIDLLDGNRLRVVDYKTGSAPNPRRALQVPVYALCAQERLSAQGAEWEIEDASYIAFSGKRAVVPVVKSGADDRDEVLGAARDRVLAILDGIGRSEFPPRPHDTIICSYCAYPSVCRKDYVGDE